MAHVVAIISDAGMFIHFLHDQLLRLSGHPGRHGWPTAPARNALRLAVFLTDDPLYLPTVDLVQSPLAEPLMPMLSRLASEELLHLAGSTTSLDDLQRSKQVHFQKTQLLPIWEARESFERLERFEGALEARTINTTTDLKQRWMADVGRFSSFDAGPADTPLTTQMRQAMLMLGKSHKRMTSAMSMVPRDLGGHAFLWSVIEELRVFPMRTTPEARRQLEVGLAWHWVTSHLHEFATSIFVGISGIGPMSFGVGTTHPAQVVDLAQVEDAFRLLGLHDAFGQLAFDEILALRHEPGTRALRETVLRPLLALRLEPDRRRRRELLAAGAEVREAARSAGDPRRAFQRAGLVALGPERGASQQGRLVPYKVAVVIALAEELNLMKAAVEAAVGPLAEESSAATGQTIFRARRFTNGKGLEIDLFFTLIGKGPEQAAARNAIVVTEQRPDMVVNVGIAGALNDDVDLADVAVARKLESYLDNSKAVGETGGGFRFRLAGQPVVTDTLLIDRVEELPMRAPEALHERVEKLRAEASRVLADPSLVDEFKFVAGAVASGPVVGASEGFRDWLLEHSRDYIAVEMEASGAGIAADVGGRIRRIRYVVLRGISDLADERKADLENETKGAVRRLATIAPLSLLMVLLDTLEPEAFTPRAF